MTRADGEGRKKEEKNSIWCLSSSFSAKQTCVKKKSFTSVVDGRATENDGGAETESQG